MRTIKFIVGYDKKSPDGSSCYLIEFVKIAEFDDYEQAEEFAMDIPDVINKDIYIKKYFALR